jgi:hypothetical protein
VRKKITTEALRHREASRSLYKEIPAAQKETVIAGLDPAIHSAPYASGRMDARVKPAHDSFLFLLLCVSVPLW